MPGVWTTGIIWLRIMAVDRLLNMTKMEEQSGRSRVPGGAHSVIRLPSGNTLVAVTDKDNNPGVFEYDMAGNIVWSLTNKDLPGTLKFAGGMHYLSDGRLFLTNWVGHVDAKNPVSFISYR